MEEKVQLAHYQVALMHNLKIQSAALGRVANFEIFKKETRCNTQRKNYDNNLHAHITVNNVRVAGE